MEDIFVQSLIVIIHRINQETIILSCAGANFDQIQSSNKSKVVTLFQPDWDLLQLLRVLGHQRRLRGRKVRRGLRGLLRHQVRACFHYNVIYT